MKAVRGPHLEVDLPTSDERSFILALLASPDIHRPLGCPRPPTRVEFDAGLLPIAEGDGMDLEEVAYLIIRDRRDRRPLGFFLHYGWDTPRDLTRELDVAFAPGARAGPALALEALVMGGIYLFQNGLARRLRWRGAHGKGAPRQLFARIGGQRLTTLTDPDPLTGELLARDLWELSREAYEGVLTRLGCDVKQLGETGEGPAPELWALLA